MFLVVLRISLKLQQIFEVFVIFVIESISGHISTQKDSNSPFHSSRKGTKLLHETEAKVVLAQLEK